MNCPMCGYVWNERRCKTCGWFEGMTPRYTPPRRRRRQSPAAREALAESNGRTVSDGENSIKDLRIAELEQQRDVLTAQVERLTLERDVAEERLAEYRRCCTCEIEDTR